MIRRDFLRALASFGAAAAAGGGVAVTAAPATEAALQPRTLPSRLASLDFRVTRGDAIWFDIAGAKINQAEVVLSSGRTKPFCLCHTTFTADGPTRTMLGMSAASTALFRPGEYRWRASSWDAPHSNLTILQGSFVVEPDELWAAEESVIGIARELHPMGIVLHRYGAYEVGLREKLRPDEKSDFSNRLESLIAHARPTRCQILNGGDGALISFKQKGLLS